MFEAYQRQKKRVKATLELDGGNTETGVILMSPEDDLGTVLNNQSQYIEFESAEGVHSFVRKSVIRRARPADAALAAA